MTDTLEVAVADVRDRLTKVEALLSAKILAAPDPDTVAQLNEIANALDDVQEIITTLQETQEELIEKIGELASDYRPGYTTFES